MISSVLPTLLVTTGFMQPAITATWNRLWNVAANYQQRVIHPQRYGRFVNRKSRTARYLCRKNRCRSTLLPAVLTPGIMKRARYSLHGLFTWSMFHMQLWSPPGFQHHPQVRELRG